MNLLIELIKALHIVFVISFTLGLVIWVYSEFESILRRKAMIGFGFMRISFFRKIFVENNLFGKEAAINFVQALRLILLIVPFLIYPYSETYKLLGDDVSLGIINVDNNIFIVLMLLIAFDLLGHIIGKSIYITQRKIFLFFIVSASLIFVADDLNFKYLLAEQAKFLDIGVRKYFIFLNPIGAIALFKIIGVELENPNERFDLLNALAICNYILLFIFLFLGGYSTPSIFQAMEKPSVLILMSVVSLFAKFVFLLVVVWVYRYVFINKKQELVVNDF